jgi:1,6-anhydro-N-acetylmuramate kinase
MGRPIGSVNRQKPFTDMLRVALLSGGGRRLRIICEKLAEKAEQGDIQAIREVGDRLDGKAVQAIERGRRFLRLQTG